MINGIRNFIRLNSLPLGLLILYIAVCVMGIYFSYLLGTPVVTQVHVVTKMESLAHIMTTEYNIKCADDFSSAHIYRNIYELNHSDFIIRIIYPIVHDTTYCLQPDSSNLGTYFYHFLFTFKHVVYLDNFHHIAMYYPNLGIDFSGAFEPTNEAFEAQVRRELDGYFDYQNTIHSLCPYYNRKVLGASLVTLFFYYLST